MNSPADLKSTSERPGSHRSALTPAAVVFVICLALGTVVVIWRARMEAASQRVQAQAEAAARGTALEIQFSRIVSVADLLASSVRQSGGAVPTFQKTAGELRAAFPDIASLELQPGGTVSEIMPRAGNERGIGLNVLSDPVHRASASMAMQRGAAAVAAPLILYSGEPGLVVRVPIFQKGRSGGDQFWGFVAVSMRFSEALRRAGLDDISKEGWDFLLFAPATPTAKAVAVARQGLQGPQGAIVQPIRVQNLELRLAVHRHGGWTNTSLVLFESMLVLMGSVVFFCLVNAVTGRRQVEAALAEAQLQLSRETEERKQTQADLATSIARTEGDLAAARTALQQAREQGAQGTQALAAATESRQALEIALKQAETQAPDLQKRWDQAAQSHKQELAGANARLAEARTGLKEAQEKTHGAEQTAAAALKARDTAMSELVAHQTGTRTQVADLQSRLDREKRGAEAVVVRLKEAEARNNELEVELAESQRALAEATDLVAQLRSAEATAARGTEVVDADIPPPPEDQPGPAGSTQETVEAVTSPAKRKRARRKDDNQIDLFADEAAPTQPAQSAQAAAPSPPTPPQEVVPPRPVDETQLRRTVNEILPLLADGDPGAKDCLKANRTLFRSALGSVAFEEFEQLIKEGTFETALERLTKLARKHGIHI